MKRIVIAAAILTATAIAAAAQSGHTHSGAHSAPTAPGIAEPGQGAFAAIAEIVALLRHSPETDWTQVDIEGLRAHLVDMDKLVMHAETETSLVEDGLEMRIRLTGEGGAAVSRMIPAHGPVLAAETGWDSIVVHDGDALVWTVRSKENPRQIQALGFFGLMAVGDHHREHHLGIATGHGMH
ncbi:hypothetical protein [Aliisedimentitalea sp. MJ-SS2]|uniref:hypothetical protein n=1 Tax=Aliisedimentitalea sp. MJ-SS2 TaxID=3049795 RepID=UPI00292D5354|nr:hypothetical protein [Alisedimentitalea sp. MJ-SS2]